MRTWRNILGDRRAGKQAGCTAAKEHGINTATPDLRQGQLQIAGQGGDVFCFLK